MAYNPGIEQDDEQQAQGADDAGTNQLAGGSGVISGQTSGQAQKQKGSGFVNIGQYLNANQADLAGQTDKAISKVNEGWNSASDKIAQSKAGFDTAADQNRVTLGDASTTDDDKQFASDFLKNSKLDQGEQQQFATWQGMDYKGPTELQDTWSADQKKSDDLASTLSNPNGYFPAMDEIFGNGRSDYTAGSQRLDASLMAADKTGQERINQNTAQQQAALGSSINAAQQSAQQKAQQYQTEAQSGKDAAWEALNEYMPSYATGLADQVAATNSARRSEYEAAKQGGGDAVNFYIDNPYATAGQGAYYDDLFHYSDVTRSDYSDNGLKDPSIGGSVGWGDRLRKELEMATYTRPEDLEVRITNPLRSNYVGQYGGDVGIGSLDPSVVAKLEALYSLSGDPSVRQGIESDISEKLGFDDVMRDGSSSAAVNFDQASYDEAVKAAKDAEIGRVLQWENDLRALKLAQQQALYDKYMR